MQNLRTSANKGVTTPTTSPSPSPSHRKQAKLGAHGPTYCGPATVLRVEKPLDQSQRVLVNATMERMQLVFPEFFNTTKATTVRTAMHMARVMRLTKGTRKQCKRNWSSPSRASRTKIVLGIFVLRLSIDCRMESPSKQRGILFPRERSCLPRVNEPRSDTTGNVHLQRRRCHACVRHFCRLGSHGPPVLGFPQAGQVVATLLPLSPLGPP